ncbi:MAG: 2-oxo acid dehydrogenase subunit E2 [Chromatiales bacterium]|nr:2-oxo acid dehydrogenase subunit E2 [Chromatiales bacterium]
MSIFRLPDLGEGLREAEIVAWHVSVGDHVVADQPLVAIETDKAVVDVPSPRAGRIARRHGEAGDVVAVGAPLVEFEDAAPEDTGAVVGEIRRPPPVPTPAEPRHQTRATTAGARGPVVPAARRLARELGIDVATIDGSGPGGAITVADVRAGAPSATAAPMWTPLRGTRRAMARNMSRARDRVMPATLTEEADVTAWSDGEEPTVRLLLALAAACRAVPALNAWLDDAAEARIEHRQVHVGLAVDTPDGLLVPVLRDVDGGDARALRASLHALLDAARERAVAPADLRGATISLSNFGMLGGLHAALAVMPPQVAIVGAGRIHDAVRVVDGAVTVRRVLPLSLTFDHRAVTGAEAARFAATLVAQLAPAAHPTPGEEP